VSLLRYGDCACPTCITGGVIGERARLTEGEREGRTLVDRTTIKRASSIGCDRMRGGIVVRPRDGSAYFDGQRIGLETGTGDGHRRRSLGRRRSVRGLDVLGSCCTSRRFLAAQ